MVGDKLEGLGGVVEDTQGLFAWPDPTRPPDRERGFAWTKLQLDSGYGAPVPTFSTVLDCRFCKPDLLPINPTFYFKIQLSATCLLVPLKYKL